MAPVGEARGAEGTLPVARGSLRFDAAYARFEGEMEWELRPGSGDLALFLYLNRYLTATNREEREIVEAYGSESAAVDRSQARRHGALLVRRATARHYEGKPCRAVVGKGVAPTSEKEAPTTFNATETLLSTSAPAPKASAESGCHTFRLTFTSHPPASLGNFGVQSDGDVMKFAGPLFPVAQNTLFETEMHYEGISLTCADCRLETSQNSVQVTKTFPAPILKAPATSPERVMFVRGLRVEFVGKSDPETEAQITKMLERVVLEGPFLASAATESSRRLVRIHMGVLLKNLASRQHGEIQLGTGFLKVSPLFRKYHEAAFLRALFQELTFQALVRHVPPGNMEELRILNSLARMAGEERVASWFSSLDEIRAWSENFRFIPFFNDILQGRALVNNDVFLGSEERPNPVDTLPFDAMFPTFRGQELAERLAWCHSVEEESAFRKEASELQKGERPAPDFVKRWRDLGKGRCAEPFRRYLFEASEPESITLRYGLVDERGGRVQFQRSDVPVLPRSLFRVPGASPLRDTLSIGVFAGKSNPQRSYRASSSGAGDRQTVVVEEPEDGVSARIEGPNTEGNKDVQVLPR
ncbi:MAG: hypothetical protein IOD12_14010, partial [Silvanigrellales bacterium]|nr:hypothetical protein [Silvanigrellales bacterium]